MKALFHFTEPQKRALFLLPADGSWLINFGKNAPAIDSLHLYFRPFVDIEWGDFGPRGGRCRRARLTPKGQEIRAQRELTESTVET